ncbi:MAG: cytochrome [Tardiphaga sp.]|nr:cytochrome [Tardiphaga sp.]
MRMPRSAWMTIIAVAAAWLAPLRADAQGAAHPSSEPTLSAGSRFGQTSGEALFANICRGCHMADGQGATGAASYPSLVNDRNLAERGYPLHVVVNGQRAMPPFGVMLNDDQVAAVVNYLRTHFENDYHDAATADDARSVRP